MKIIAAVLAVLLLAGCVAGEQVRPQDRVAEAQALFNSIMPSVVSYARQPDCAAGVTVACSDPKVEAEMVAAAKDAQTALDLAWTDTANVDNATAALTLVRGMLRAAQNRGIAQ